jgi:hypothetical protein
MTDYNKNPSIKNHFQYPAQDVDDGKLKKEKIKKCQKILRELFFNSILIGVLFTVAYSNRNTNSFNYRFQTQQTFVSYQDVTNINGLWDWLVNEFLVNLKVDVSEYDVSVRESLDSYTSDLSSILIGFPIIRQLRVKKSRRKYLLHIQYKFKDT